MLRLILVDLQDGFKGVKLKASPTVFEPGTKPWYRRTWAIATIAILAIAIVVVSDYPRSATKADRSSQYQILQTTMWGQIQSCNASLADSIIAVTAIINKTSNQLSTAKAIVSNAEPNCSPIGNSDLLDLASTSIPNILQNYHINVIVNSLGSWAFPDAAQILIDFKGILVNPKNTALLADIVSHQKAMDRLAAKAQATMNLDAKELGVAPKTLGLTTIKNYPSALVSVS
ncbi:hypothetical protein AXFE_23580 [Acidithrix ferrooxidans]|uniref:Uncharacterized protein n=1 Tax=Acidithrix ferrooxidans TaxID=1280514 RepID=A0A0D8HFW2_9ACTN|nr:hypothetical protein AXFE_23580 [Acidithrix ferrooxidans]CAG4931224.1 unnamed protein product [Acidithrix sp. C25]